jgi:DNA gyrase/topoisomerase IV subunit A
MDDPEAPQLRDRLHVLDGLLDALGRMEEVNDAIRSSPDRPAAITALQSPPFSYSEVVANHVLDLTVGRQTVAAIEQLQEEREGAVGRLKSLTQDTQANI